MSPAGRQVHFKAMRKIAGEHQLEQVGEEIRKLIAGTAKMISLSITNLTYLYLKRLHESEVFFCIFATTQPLRHAVTPLLKGERLI